jgi:solute carrier family 35 protein
MYMNSLIGTPLLFTILVVFYPDTLLDAYHFENWDDPQFVVLFLLSSAMGTILQFSIFYCTKVNSALTTVVTGVLKNVLTSYAGMLDVRLGYTFNWTNFVGINLSMVGGIWYAYLQFVEGAASNVSNQNSVKNKEQGEKNVDDEEERPMLKS